MTQEEKAKRYDEAIERANELRYVSDKDSLQCKTAEHIFPELKESMWEEIKKALIIYHSSTGSTHVLDKFTSKQICDWLEKQDEKKSTEWSEKDKHILNNIYNFVAENLLDKNRGVCADECLKWLNLLKDRVQSQNNITDEELAQAKKDAYNDALDKIEYHSGEPTFDDGWSAAIWYMKKRNAQPQSTWEPSDEQMHAFEQVYDWYNNNFAASETLTSLYQDLKKLREE